MSAETPGSTTDDTPARGGDVAGRPEDSGGDGPQPDGSPTGTDPAPAAEPAGRSASTTGAGAGDAADDGRIGEHPPGDAGAIGGDDLDEARTPDDLDESRTGDTEGGSGPPAWTTPEPLPDAGAPGSASEDSALGATAPAGAVGEEPGSGVDESSLGATAPADVIGDETLVGATAPADAVDETLAADLAPQATVPYGGAVPAGPPTLEQPPVAAAPPARRVPPGARRTAQQRGLRITQRLLSVSPWSVFKVSALFYLCTLLVVLVAGTILWNIGRSAGAIDSLENFITRLGAYGTCVEESQVAEGVDFQTDQECRDGEVLVGGFEIDDGVLWRAAAIGGGVLVVASSIGTVLMVVLLNLLNEVTGGVRHTVVTEPAGRPRRGSTVAARRR